MIRKFVTTLFILSLILINQAFASDIKPDEQSFDYYKSVKFDEIFDELYALVSKNPEKDKEVFKSIDFIKNKIDKKEVLLLVNKIPDDNILTGAYFIANLEDMNKSKPILCLNINQAAYFDKQKSIIFSMLMHEIRHAYDFYNNYGLFKVTDNNILERFLFQMDALYTEVLLIQNYLLPNNFSLTEFEKELLSSHQNDNLATYSLIYEGVDMKLIYGLSGYRYDDKSYAKNINDLTNIGRNLLDSFDPDNKNDSYEKYREITTLLSFTTYAPQIAYEIYYSKEKKVSPADFSFKSVFPELSKIIIEGKTLIENHLNHYNEYRAVKFNSINDFEILKNYDIALEKYEEEIILPYEYYIIDSPLLYIHIIPDEEAISKGQLGTIENMPKQITNRNDFQIKKSKNLYVQKKYKEAVELLEKVIIEEPDNPFVLETYARTLYWYDSEKSFRYYQKLIKILDTEETKKYVELIPDLETFKKLKESRIKNEIIELNKLLKETILDEKIKINLWFPEAYWKIGTLYLDQKNYLMGAFEITRALICGIQKDSDILAEQIYSYLCEAYFYLGKYNLSSYCAEIAFTINPKNEYVQYYISEIKKITDE